MKPLDTLTDNEFDKLILDENHFIPIRSDMSDDELIYVGRCILSVFEHSKHTDSFNIGKMTAFCLSTTNKEQVIIDISNRPIHRDSQIVHVWKNAFTYVIRNDSQWLKLGKDIMEYGIRQINLNKKYRSFSFNWMPITFNLS